VMFLVVKVRCRHLLDLTLRDTCLT
jgi:hypothetical protein